FREHVDLQARAIQAWITHAEGKTAQAVKALKATAAAEEKLGKHPVSPGPIYPMYDQLGELLLEAKKPAEALAAFETSLASSPRRFNTLAGAGRAAAAAGQAAKARAHFQALVEMAPGS